jgi:hypothetical protein
MKKVIKLGKLASLSLKFDLKMKLTTLLLIVSLFQIQANESYGQKAKVTLSLENETVENILNEIESLTEFKFFYNYDEIDYKKEASINAYKENISSVLKRLFSNSDISFKVLEKQIILKTKSELENKTLNQQTQVSGIVTDETNSPLLGVSILVKGTSRGAVTDFDGSYSLAANEGESLVFSYQGFATQEITIESNLIINIKLLPDNKKLDEVVLIGYGSLEKRDVNSAIESIKGEKVFLPAVNSIDRLLGGENSRTSSRSNFREARSRSYCKH